MAHRTDHIQQEGAGLQGRDTPHDQDGVEAIIRDDAPPPPVVLLPGCQGGGQLKEAGGCFVLLNSEGQLPVA